MKDFREYYGVISPIDLLQTTLKKEAIYFDRIAIPNIKENFVFKNEIMKCPIRSIDFLIEHQIIIDPVEKYLGRHTYLKKIGEDTYQESLKQIDERSEVLTEELSHNLDLHFNMEDPALMQMLKFPWTEAAKKTQINSKRT